MSEQDLYDASIRNQVHLERLKAQSTKDIIPFLKSISDYIVRRLSYGDISDYSQSRLTKLLKAIDDVLVKEFSAYSADVKITLKQLSKIEAAFEAASLTNAIDGFEAIIPSAAQVTAAVTAKPLSIRGSGAGLTLKQTMDNFTATQRKHILGAIKQGAFEGQTNSQIIKNVRGTAARQYKDGVLGLTYRQSEALIRTLIQQTASVSRAITMQENGLKEYQWRSVLDSKTSEICQGLSNEIFTHGEGPYPPAHFNCLPGDSLVTPCGSVTGGFKRWFDGEVIIIKTAAGRELTCTPNHPILTRSGWIDAHRIDEIGNVACCLPEHRRSSGFNVHHQNVITTIEDEVNAFFSSGDVCAMPVPVASEDFHGDGANSKVAIVATYSGLSNNVRERWTDKAKYFVLNIGRTAGLVLLRSLGEFAFFLKCSFAPFGGSVRGRSQALNVGSTGATHSGKLLFRPVAECNSVTVQDSLDGGWTDVEFVRDASNTDAGGVFFDDVVSVEKCKFSNHVYNLECEQSIYFTGDIITHNCRSTIVTVVPDEFKFLEDGATQAAEFGPVPVDQTYYDWLSNQTKEFQDSAIGPKYGKLFRDGGLTTDEFQRLRLDKNFKPLTLDEMEKIVPDAFKKAGI